MRYDSIALLGVLLFDAGFVATGKFVYLVLRWVLVGDSFAEHLNGLIINSVIVVIEQKSL